jgi:hypothetical protein
MSSFVLARSMIMNWHDLSNLLMSVLGGLQLAESFNLRYKRV